MNSMADSKCSKQKEEHLESKTKSCHPIRKNTKVEKTFQESALKSHPTNKLIIKIINHQLDIKFGQFMEKELNIILTIIKKKKLQALMKYLQKYGRQGTLSINKIRLRNGQKCASSPFSRMVTMQSLRTMVTSIAAKVYNALLLNQIKPEIKKIL